MTLDSASSECPAGSSESKDESSSTEDAKSFGDLSLDLSNKTTSSNIETKPPSPNQSQAVVGKISDHNSNENLVNNGDNCYNRILDDEIRSRLDKLNALSDLINSLEGQFDEANSKFREILKCSTERLSSIAKALGTKSIRRGRDYQTAKISVEQSQSECQKACIQFEQATIDHQIAKNAIKEAELKFKEMASEQEGQDVIKFSDSPCIDSIDLMSRLKLTSNSNQIGRSRSLQSVSSCDNDNKFSSSNYEINNSYSASVFTSIDTKAKLEGSNNDDQATCNDEKNSPAPMITIAARLGEELNQAVIHLIEAEKKRTTSEKQHLDGANKLIIAQENLTRLERAYGHSIRRTQLYFDEAKRFNAKLNSVKGDICRINADIIAAKQAYARTLSDLERFSDELHDNPEMTVR